MHYRCYFMSGESIRDVAIVEAGDDGESFLRAEELLSASVYPIIEIWLDKRLVGRFAHVTDIETLAAAMNPALGQAQ